MLSRSLSIGAVLLLGLALVPAAPLQAYSEGTVVVHGRVDLGPTCPVQQIGQDCTDEGVVARVTATRLGVRLHVRADADGFRIRVPRGVWRFTANAGMSCPTVRVDARAHRPPFVVIDCDTGIR